MLDISICGRYSFCDDASDNDDDGHEGDNDYIVDDNDVDDDDKTKKCSKCDYACLQTSYLKRHLKINTGEKPYKCSQCDFTI